MRRWVVVALVCGGVASPAQDGGVGAALGGSWKLDDEASSDLGPMLEHYGASVLVRQFARSVRPLNVIAWRGDRLEIEVHAFTVDRKSTVVLDGQTPTRDELFGNPYQYTSTVEDGAVVSTGRVRHGDGEEDALTLRRFVAADGTMVLQMLIVPPKGPPLSVRRVFDRVTP